MTQVPAKVPWYFMWSENYRFFYEILKDRMKEPEMELRPIEIPQSRFDSELYQYSEDKAKHFWHGSFIKVDCVIKSLEECEEPYMLFSDIDIITQPGVYAGLKPYMEEGYDMVYLKEGEHTNIGFMLLKKEPGLKFWRAVKQAMIDDLELDQYYVNRLLPKFEGKWGHFSQDIFLCSNGWQGQKSWAMIQLLCSCLSKEFNMAEKVFYMAQHINNLNDYMPYVKPEIIPYIYKFQELLMKQKGVTSFVEDQPTLTN